MSVSDLQVFYIVDVFLSATKIGNLKSLDLCISPTGFLDLFMYFEDFSIKTFHI